MSLGERLKIERERLGLSQTALAKACGVGKTTQINYEKNYRSPDANYLQAAENLGVRTYWVIFGEHLSEKENTFDDHLSKNEIIPKNLIPLYDLEGTSGGACSLTNDNVAGELQIDPDTIQALGIHDAHLVGIRVRGDSMQPTLSDNERVIVNLDDTNFAQGGVFLVALSGEIAIKRVQRLMDGSALIISDNTVYERETIDPKHMDEFVVLGRVVLRLGRVL